MTEDTSILVKIPAEWIEEIEDLFGDDVLKALKFLPKIGSVKGFVLQAVMNEMCDLNECRNIRLQVMGNDERTLKHFRRDTDIGMT